MLLYNRLGYDYLGDRMDIDKRRNSSARKPACVDRLIAVENVEGLKVKIVLEDLDFG
jgi:hypothetical protein